MDAFDADVLIYAAEPDHRLGRRVAALLERTSDESVRQPGQVAAIGSVLLLPELLSKPRRLGDHRELEALGAVLTYLDLQPLDADTADLAVGLGARYHLRAPDAVHLATAVAAGADRFLTNNRRDFARTITEVEVVYPDDLPDPDG